MTQRLIDLAADTSKEINENSVCEAIVEGMMDDSIPTYRKAEMRACGSCSMLALRIREIARQITDSIDAGVPTGPVTAKYGVLWRGGQIVPAPEADALARKHGFEYAEQYVAHLQNGAPINICEAIFEGEEAERL